MARAAAAAEEEDKGSYVRKGQTEGVKNVEVKVRAAVAADEEERWRLCGDAMDGGEYVG